MHAKFLVCSAAIALAQAATTAALAAPVTYHFSTAPGAFDASLPGLFGSGDFVSGTFMYDAQAPATGTAPGGFTTYGVYTSVPPILSSFTGLAGTVAGRNFSDPRGFTSVGDEAFTFPITLEQVDFLQLTAESAVHNMTGFSIGAFTLANVRMFWIESQASPDPIPDFLGGNSLPALLPVVLGRLALDFTSTGSPGPLLTVTFDGLRVEAAAAVPEPGTFALVLAGLGLLGFGARRG